ncbi:MAG: RraA family protein, partial [Candidatus Latescibacterota bacterium]
MEKFAPLNMSPEELIEYTPEWQGERFDDGRPKVPDDIVERMRQVTITQAWGVVRGDGYEH